MSGPKYKRMLKYVELSHEEALQKLNLVEQIPLCIHTDPAFDCVSNRLHVIWNGFRSYKKEVPIIYWLFGVCVSDIPMVTICGFGIWLTHYTREMNCTIGCLDFNLFSKVDIHSDQSYHFWWQQWYTASGLVITIIWVTMVFFFPVTTTARKRVFLKFKPFWLYNF